jgi:hypothetical protein
MDDFNHQADPNYTDALVIVACLRRSRRDLAIKDFDQVLNQSE